MGESVSIGAERPSVTVADVRRAAAAGAGVIRETPVVYFAFDLLHCDGYDLRAAPLLERKQLLQRMLHATERFRYADHQAEQGKELYELAKENGLEGIVAKRADSRYVSDRSTSWAKLKVSQTLDAVVGGWTEARTEAIPFGSLLLGLYEGKKLRFIGRTQARQTGRPVRQEACGTKQEV